MDRRVKQVNDAAEKAHNIREAIEKIARIKEKAIVEELLGIPLSSETETSESESEEETEEVYQVEENEEDISSSMQRESNGESRSNMSHKLCDTAKAELDRHGRTLVDILRKCDLNWFQFTSVARENLEDIQSDVFGEMATYFYEQLSSFGMSEVETNIVKQSHQVYKIRKSQEKREIDIEEGNIVCESNESSSDIDSESLISPYDSSGLALIKKRRAAIRRKATRNARRRIAEERLLKRRKSKKVSRILRDCPDIGKTIEDFVQKCGAGADAWRRTGVITFDGNKKIEKKATFKRVKEHLENKYQRKISYGTVVELCIARNKRRRSAARYKGVAKVIQKKSKKGIQCKVQPRRTLKQCFIFQLRCTSV
jgi:hypothetical protein